MLLMKVSAEGEPGVSERSTCSRSPGANLDAQPAFVEYFVSLMRVRSSIAAEYKPSDFDVTLRGRAATPQGWEKVRTLLEGLPQISRVLDAAALEALHTSDKLGTFAVEAEAPWGFGPSEPDGEASRGAR
jgi:hypothetical protein